MAGVEHCLLCFEALAAHLEDRESMSLAGVRKSWADYVAFLEADRSDNDEPVEQGKTGGGGGGNSNKLAKRLPAFRRLVGSSSGSSSSSSTSSGSSSPSSASSTTSLQQTAGDNITTAATSVFSLTSTTPPPPLTESPLFVTWNKASSRDGYSLRGCIGTFEPQPLEEGLSSYALTSALQDMRFSPVTKRELPSLEVAVTLLTDFEDCADAADWEVGTHGLRISFYYHGKRYGATYLPDVATEQGWTKDETVVSLMRKAGWMGRKDKWRDVELKVVRYQGRKESLEYAEFKRWRDWADKNEEGNEKEKEAT